MNIDWPESSEVEGEGENKIINIIENNDVQK